MLSVNAVMITIGLSTLLTEMQKNWGKNIDDFHIYLYYKRMFQLHTIIENVRGLKGCHGYWDHVGTHQLEEKDGTVTSQGHQPNILQCRSEVPYPVYSHSTTFSARCH